MVIVGGGAPRAETPMDRPNFCKALDRFSSAPPHDRWALFFWPLPSDDTIDMYAAMAAKPMDGAAHGFYAAYGQTTHYILLTKLKARLDECSAVKLGRVRLEASEAACDGYQSGQPCLSIRRVAPR
ncbi:hypothetical protein [Caulobacter soli]|uniref:hypothetical protein n=1 Tax=Caulobacter soli TaxID=2708539 RepID=UPI0013EC39DB|nr:hypothetical protein [Caulobacter soli]